MSKLANIIVLIPLYQKRLPALEQYSVDYSVRSLAKRKLCFFGPTNLERSYYNHRYPDIPYATFDDHYFTSVQEYSRLMLSEEFYQRFARYEFILLMQPDAIVLRDELEWWCQQPYDYVGAPWPAEHIRISFGDGKTINPNVGNGGLSLRRVEGCRSLLNSAAFAVNVWQKAGLNEDQFFSGMALLESSFRVPGEYLASRFSMEWGPSHYFSVNGGFLPMGGHAWFQYEPEFWLPLLKQKHQNIPQHQVKEKRFTGGEKNKALKAISKEDKLDAVSANNVAAVPPPPPCSEKAKSLLATVIAAETFKAPNDTLSTDRLQPKVVSIAELFYRRDMLYELARKRLTTFLSVHHGVTDNQRFWEIILWIFLEMFVSNYLARWNSHLLNNDFNSLLSSGRFPKSTSLEFQKLCFNVHGCESPFLGLKLTSGGKKLLMNAKKIDTNIKLESGVISVIKKLSNGILNSGNFAFLVFDFFPEYWIQHWGKFGIQTVKFPEMRFSFDTPVNWQDRMDLAGFDEDIETSDYPGFWTSIAVALPKEFLENFLIKHEVAIRIIENKKPEFIYSLPHLSLMPNIATALFCMESVPFIGGQHGAGYGEYPHHLGQVVERRMNDQFYSWGWTGNSEKIVAVEPTRLMRLAQEFSQYKKDPKEILILGSIKTDVPRFSEGTDFSPNWEDALFSYIRSLTPKERKRLVYRVRKDFFDYSNQKIQAIKNAFPDIRLDLMERSIASAYANACVVVIEEVVSTACWECAYLGVPFFRLNQIKPTFRKIPSHIALSY